MKIDGCFKMKSTRELLQSHGINDFGKGQRYTDKEAIRIMKDYTPKETAELIRSADRLTKIGSGLIRQGGSSAPYARKWYYEDAKFNGAPIRGNYWFTRAMQNGGKKAILKGLKRELGIK